MSLKAASDCHYHRRRKRRRSNRHKQKQTKKVLQTKTNDEWCSVWSWKTRQLRINRSCGKTLDSGYNTATMAKEWWTGQRPSAGDVSRRWGTLREIHLTCWHTWGDIIPTCPLLVRGKKTSTVQQLIPGAFNQTLGNNSDRAKKITEAIGIFWYCLKNVVWLVLVLKYCC